MLALIVTSIVLVFTVGPKVSAADDTIYLVPEDCLNISGTTLNGLTADGISIYQNGGLKYRVEIPEGITNINSCAFENCTGLINIVFSDTVTSIGEKAFSGCNKLVAPVWLPENITSIGSYAFRNCDSLRWLFIPENVSYIGSCVVYGNSNLFIYCEMDSEPDTWESDYYWYYKTATGGGGRSGAFGCVIDEDFIISNRNTILRYFGSGGNVVIPDYITGIGGFDYCKDVTSVTMSDGVEFIGENTFRGCTGLTSIVIPSTVTKIWGYAFSSCTGLNSVYYLGTLDQWVQISYVSANSNPLEYASKLIINDLEVTDAVLNSATQINANAFYGYKGLTSIEIPNSVTSIGSSAFQNCTGLTSIEIPNSVTSIGYNAFLNCTGLTSIEIPSSVTTIRSYPFSGCTSLMEIIVEDPVWLTSSALSSYRNILHYYLDVTFNSNQGSAVDNARVDYGTTVTQPTNPTRDGYTIINWCTDPECNNDFNFSTLITEDIILYAKWGKNPTITFNTDDGSEVQPVTITYNTTVTRPDTDPTKSGYRFINWCTDAECNNNFNFSTPITEDKIIYAKWIKVYTVTFDSNGGSDVEPEIIDHNQYAYWRYPYRENYGLAYWYLDNEDEAFDFNTPITADITLSAKWELNRYWVSFYDGNKFLSEQEIEHGSNLAMLQPTKKNYTFIGWYTDYACTRKYDFDEPVTQSMALYAKWVRDYTVTFKSMGGTAVPNQIVHKGETAAEPISELAGYRLVGWYTDVECTRQYDFATPITANKTLYAKWEEIPVEKVTNNSTVALAVGGGVGGVAGLSVIGTIIGVVVKKRKK